MAENTPLRNAGLISFFVGMVVLGSYAPFTSAYAATIPGCPYVFTRSLSQGSTGIDVQKLQMLLNSDVVSQVAASGPGSRGNETQYFGPATKNAVVQFQQKHAAQILTPAGLVSGTGFVGALTRAKLNALCVSIPTTPSTPITPTTPSNPSTRGPEASIEKYKVLNAPSNEDIEERETKPVLTAAFDVEDSDATLSRVDVNFTAVGTIKERRPWYLLDEVTLYVGDKKADTLSVDRESAWRKGSNNTYSLRFSGLKNVLKEGSTQQLTVEVKAQDRVDSSDVPQDFEVWFPDRGIRMRDGAKIDQYTGDNDERRDFTIERAGLNQELKVRASNNDPDPTVLQVKTNQRSSVQTVAVFELEAKDGSASIESLPITFYTHDDSGGSKSFANVVEDVYLEIDGTRFDDYTEGVGITEVIGGASTTATILTFEMDRNELSIARDAKKEVKVRAVFRKIDGNYLEGQKVMVAVTQSNVDAIDAEGVRALGADKLTGSSEGEVHMLRSEGVILVPLANDSRRDVASVGADQGHFTVKIKVTAFEDDFYVPLTAARVDASGSVISGNADGGVYFAINSDGIVADGTAAASLSSSARIQNNAYLVREGESEEFTLKVSFIPDTTAFYQMQLSGVRFRTEGQVDSAAELMEAVRAQTYRTDVLFLSID
jgi:peptidoglycan hydrolase-like protein with peptidoglycan-binding domain